MNKTYYELGEEFHENCWKALNKDNYIGHACPKCFLKAWRVLGKTFSQERKEVIAVSK